MKNSLTSSLKNKFGVRGIDTIIACDLNEVLKTTYSGGFDFCCLDSSDFELGGFFTKEEASELVVLASLDGITDLEKLGHLMLYGF